ncbi:MAG: glycosyltransferase family 2 protein [Microcystaceae cyanobacterium]
MAKVTVCIPTYNRANFLKYSLESVLNQSYTDFELIICDDGSSDNTPEMIKQYDDSRIRYLRHPQNIGRSRNMRSGFEAATGAYFIKFDDDDGLTPTYLEKTVKILDDNPDADFVCTSHWIIDRNHQQIESATKANEIRWGKDQIKEGMIPDLLKQTFEQQSLQVGSTLFRQACLTEVDYMRPEADGCEDYDLLVRLAIAQKQGYFLPERLMEYRFHGGQTSLKQDIHFLKAKSFCLDSYQFDEQNLENIRIRKLAGLRQDLGLRLIEKGETKEGRDLLTSSQQVLGQSNRSRLGFILSYLPLALRKALLDIFRNLRQKDYTAQVRDS